jgi:hypothetical protein
MPEPRPIEVKVRLKGEMAAKFTAYAQSRGLPMATALRTLAYEALQRNLQDESDEQARRRANQEKLKSQLRE